MWGYMHGYGWDGMGFGMVGMLLFWILLIAAIIVLIKYTRSSGDSSERQQEKSALDILKERYARGEIGREEFEQKKHDLSD
ncbi:MAG: SHOCT domain-containing protein [Betaproteobacteria bacterium]|nr:SHOCT domain-containing protein [Betaproteobacteria bacterium]